MLKEYKLYVYCSGMGGASRGFLEARGEYKGSVGRFRFIGAVDVDPLACQDHEMLTDFRPTLMDLFTRDDYTDFHGHEPPEGWREATARDIRESSGGECPDAVFLTPPCKGYTSLLPRAKSESPKYQALNNLAFRCIELTVKAWEDDLPAVILFENVPRITVRGKDLLFKIKRILAEHGYEFHEGYHNCGVLGGLGQNRRRYLLIARNRSKIPNLIYRPPRHKLKTIGEVIGPLPLPGDPDLGQIHRLPKLQWLTWKRLAMIEPGGDWRDLERLGREWFANAYSIIPWCSPAGTGAGGNSPSCGRLSVGDIRLGHVPRDGVYQVAEWHAPSRSIIGSARPGGSNGVAAVGDPRQPFNNVFRVTDWGETPGAVTGGKGQTGTLVGDTRTFPFSNVHRVESWDRVSRVVTSATRPIVGALSVGDPRLSPRELRHPCVYRVVKNDEVAPCVTGSRFGSGAIGYGDVRFPENHGYPNKFQVIRWDEAAATVTGIHDVQAGASSVGDPRVCHRHRNGVMGVNRWDRPSATVLGSLDVHSGAAAVGDPRTPGIQPDDGVFSLPRDSDRGVWVIISPWETWNRPLTVAEILALQSFPVFLNRRPLVLAGRSEAGWRDRIGNAVPPNAARAMGEQILDSLLVADAGDWALGSTGVWVSPGRQGLAEDCYGMVLTN